VIEADHHQSIHAMLSLLYKHADLFSGKQRRQVRVGSVIVRDHMFVIAVRDVPLTSVFLFIVFTLGRDGMHI
jgi:hypothetical protein